MINDDTIRGIAMDSDLLRLADSWHGSAAEFSAFARAVWSLGRDAGLEEAAKALEKEALCPVIDQWDAGYDSGQRACLGRVRALKENRHDR